MGRAQRGAQPVIKSKLGTQLDGYLKRALPFLFRSPINPNLLTVIGSLVSLAAAAIFAQGWFVAGGVVMLLGGVFDLVDGVMARHFGITSRFGAFLDATLDRLADMAVLLGIALYFAGEGKSGVVLLAGVAMVTTMLVSYAQARAELVVSDFRVGVLERAERVIILGLGALTGLLIPALWIIAIGSTITVGQRIALAHRRMEQLDAAERVAKAGEHG